MPRKRKLHSENYYKALPTALRGLFEERDYTHQDLAEYLGKTRQMVSCYCDGSSSPGWEAIARIADFFSVSTDYLLGRSNIQSQREDIQVACATTGLSEKAVTYLHQVKEISNVLPKSKRMSILSDLLEQRDFDTFLAHIEGYIFEMQLKSQTEYSGSADYLGHKGELLKHGYVILPAEVQAQTRFNEELVIRLRTLLRNIAAERAQKDREAEEFQEGFEMLKVNESELPKEIKKATGGNR